MNHFYNWLKNLNTRKQNILQVKYRELTSELNRAPTRLISHYKRESIKVSPNQVEAATCYSYQTSDKYPRIWVIKWSFSCLSEAVQKKKSCLSETKLSFLHLPFLEWQSEEAMPDASASTAGYISPEEELQIIKGMLTGVENQIKVGDTFFLISRR